MKLKEKLKNKFNCKIVMHNVLDGSNLNIGHFRTLKSCNRFFVLLEKITGSRFPYEYYIVRR